MVNIVGGRTLVPPTVGGPPLTEAKMTARAILQCRPNSHPFPERTLILDQPVKIGRSVARARPANSNAIFDCKVLSRNHALLWYENGKFYLQDTKSSNGTFVNNQRLSKGSEESAPREVCSGDIVQFGVDVMENSRKVTHGCIVATLKLYMPDGQEAKASPSTVVGGAVSSVSAQELYQLRTYLQEAQHREQQIETKLAALQRLVASTQEAATHSWNAMIDEDRLLQRLEILEAQLTTYAKNYPEDSVREEMRRLLDDKGQYETTAKESLRRVLQEKLDAVTKLADLERTLSTSEDELSHLKNLCETSQRELTELLEKQTTQTEQVNQLTEKLKASEDQIKDTEENYEQEKTELNNKLKEKTTEENKHLARIESLTAEIDFTKEQLSAMKAKFENIKNGEISGLIKPLKDSPTDLENLSLESSEEVKQALETTQREIFTLKDRLQGAEDELRQAEANVSQLKHEAELADSAEADCLSSRARLQEELSENKSKVAVSTALIEHLQDQISTLENRLQEYQMMSEMPKIYDDIDDENVSTLVRRKKDTKKSNKDKVNEDDEIKDKTSNELLDETLEADTTLTIIPTKDPCKDSNVNGSIEDKDDKELEVESALRTDIQRLRELLDSSKETQENAEKEITRIHEELSQASKAATTASHESSNLRQQLAASEALMSERVKMVGSLQGQVSRLETSSEEVHSHLYSVTSRLKEEQLKAQTAQEEMQLLTKKLLEAEELVKLSVQEAEHLKGRIANLEERLQFRENTPDTPLILPPTSRHPLANSDSSREETIVESETIEASDYSSADSESTSVTITNSQITPLDITDPSITKELEVNTLKGLFQKLQEELAKSKEQYLSLKENMDKNLEQQKKKIQLEQQDKVDDKQPPVVDEVDSDKFKALQDELLLVQTERDDLKRQLASSNEEFEVLGIQNKMAVVLSVLPLCIVLLGFITAFYDTLSAITGTTEYNPS